MYSTPDIPRLVGESEGCFMKHTKGKWIWHGKGKKPNFDGLDGFSLENEKGEVILKGVEHWASEMPDRADQALIASAPKLLEACEEVSATLKKLMYPNAMERMILKILQQAIKQAKVE